MLMVQATLIKDNSQMVTWLESKPNLKVGRYVTLKDVEGEWKISTLHSKLDKKLIHSDWKVGRL